MRVHLANKILSGFSTILSLILVTTCIWILTSLVIQKYGNAKEDCETNKGKYDDGSPCNNSTQPSFEDEHMDFQDAVVVDSAEQTKRKRSINNFLTDFNEMNSAFFTISLICLSFAIVASLIQFICSLVIICSPFYKIATWSRRIVVVLFILFIVFLACLAWPLAYKREYTDGDDTTMHTITTLNAAISDFIMNFEMNQVFKDLTLYYFGLFVNSIFLFFYMVITCCLLRCNDSDNYNYDI